MPRTSLDRSETSYNSSTFVERRIDTNEVLTSTSESKASASRVETRVTVNTPGWKSGRKRLVDRDDLPINPFSYSLRRSNSSYGVETWRHPDLNRYGMRHGVLEKGTNMEPRLITQSMRDRIDAEALAKLFRSAKDQSVNLGIIFAERKQTSQLVLSTARQIAEAQRAARAGAWKIALDSLGVRVDHKQRKGYFDRNGLRLFGRTPNPKNNWGRVAANSKELANRWLELVFGWRPMLQDIEDSIIALAKARERVFRTRIAAAATFRQQEANTNESWEGLPVRRSENAIYARRYVLFVDITHDGRKSLSELGITNLASIVWEVTPFSFVWDWIFPIGRFLDSLDAFAGLSFSKGSNTFFEKTDVRYKCANTRAEYGGYRKIDGTASKLHIDCQRSVMTSFPDIPLPYFRPKFSSERAVTSLALIRQRLK